MNRYRVEAWAATVVGAVVHALPRSAALALGALMGRLLAAIDRRHVAIVVDNLRHAFPDWPEERLYATARGVYAHFGRILFDILWMERRAKEEVLPLVEFHGTEAMTALIAEKRGIVYCTAHLGNWEVHAVAYAWLYGPVSVVARPLDNPTLDARLCAFRSGSGNRIIYKRKALAQIIRALRDGEGVAILLDQNVQAKDGIFVDFFGRPAATTTVAAALALKTGCALVPCHTELQKNGRYKLICDPPMTWTATDDHEADIARITQELATRAEEWIRRTPEQWLWMHRRWKTRPPAEARG